MLTACSLPTAAVFVFAALTAAGVNAVSPPIIEKCCPPTTQYMCNTLGSVGSATRTPVCCKDGTWGCTRPGAAGPSGCDPEVGFNRNPACDGKLPSENSFMIAPFEDSFSWPGGTLRVRAGSNSVEVSDGYTPFVWRAGRLANYYNQNSCLVANGSKLLFGPCKGCATIWETIPVKPKEMWKKKGDGEPVVNVVTGEGSKRRCLELRSGTPPGGDWTQWAEVVKCNGKQEQKWFLWNGNEALA